MRIQDYQLYIDKFGGAQPYEQVQLLGALINVLSVEAVAEVGHAKRLIEMVAKSLDSKVEAIKNHGVSGWSHEPSLEEELERAGAVYVEDDEDRPARLAPFQPIATVMTEVIPAQVVARTTALEPQQDPLF